MSKDNGSKPRPWSILAWPVWWVIGWFAEKFYRRLELSIDLEDDEPVFSERELQLLENGWTYTGDIYGQKVFTKKLPADYYMREHG